MIKLIKKVLAFLCMLVYNNFYYDGQEELIVGKSQEELRKLRLKIDDATNCISIIWGVEDLWELITEKRLDSPKYLEYVTDADLLLILKGILAKHDCSYGVTWDTLSIALQEYDTKERKMTVKPKREVIKMASGYWVWDNDYNETVDYQNNKAHEPYTEEEATRIKESLDAKYN